MRLGIYVGSFNPPHNGHIHIVNYLLNNNLVDKVLILPTPSYWNKINIDTKYRVEMLKMYETENIIIDDIHNNYKYTYQVLNSIKKDYKDDELYLIIGSDNLEKLHLWKNINDILTNKIIVLKRNKIIKNKYLTNYDKQFIYCNDFDYIDISSTDIRNGKFTNIDDKIIDYIKQKKLYKTLN